MTCILWTAVSPLMSVQYIRISPLRVCIGFISRIPEDLFERLIGSQVPTRAHRVEITFKSLKENCFGFVCRIPENPQYGLLTTNGLFLLFILRNGYFFLPGNERSNKVSLQLNNFLIILIVFSLNFLLNQLTKLVLFAKLLNHYQFYLNLVSKVKNAKKRACHSSTLKAYTFHKTAKL